MLTVDARCTMRRCTRAETGNIYRMVGRCSNCGAEPVLVLYTSGHDKHKVDCPKCGVSAVLPTRLASDEEIPVA